MVEHPDLTVAKLAADPFDILCLLGLKGAINLVNGLKRGLVAIKGLRLFNEAREVTIKNVRFIISSFPFTLSLLVPLGFGIWSVDYAAGRCAAHLRQV